MDRLDALQLLAKLRAELATVPTSSSSREFVSWRARTQSVLNECLGSEHEIVAAFRRVSYTPSVYGGDDSVFPKAFRSGAAKADGYLEAAQFELERRTGSTSAGDGDFDAELWAHVRELVERSEWGKVASQTVIFTEDRIRRWAGRPPSEVGERLMTSVYGDRGEFRLGLTDGEKQGWHRLAMGIAMAVRNADAHRIQRRSDDRQYAMGVVGVSSLLLTQTRYEHGNRFHDTAPTRPDADVQ